MGIINLDKLSWKLNAVDIKAKPHEIAIIFPEVICHLFTSDEFVYPSKPSISLLEIRLVRKKSSGDMRRLLERLLETARCFIDFKYLVISSIHRRRTK